jgi:hypothetical protein
MRPLVQRYQAQYPLKNSCLLGFFGGRRSRFKTLPCNLIRICWRYVFALAEMARNLAVCDRTSAFRTHWIKRMFLTPVASVGSRDPGFVALLLSLELQEIKVSATFLDWVFPAR